MGQTTGGWPPVGFCAADDGPLSPAAQPAFSPPRWPFIYPVCHEFSHEDIKGHSAGSLVKGQIKKTYTALPSSTEPLISLHVGQD